MIELLLSIALLSITHPGSFEYPIVQQERIESNISISFISHFQEELLYIKQLLLQYQTNVEKSTNNSQAFYS